MNPFYYQSSIVRKGKFHPKHPFEKAKIVPKHINSSVSSFLLINIYKIDCIGYTRKMKT